MADSGAGRASAAMRSRVRTAEKNWRRANAIVRAGAVVSEMTEQAESGHAPAQRSTKKSVKHPAARIAGESSSALSGSLPKHDQRDMHMLRRETVMIGYERSSQLTLNRRVLRTGHEARERACGR